jgi:Zn-dependent M28 family amino/carboxypeptidase
MSRRSSLAAALLLIPVAVLPLAAAGHSGDEAASWWRDVQALAGDDMQGRMTGSTEHRRAAEYVARAFADSGLAPAGTDGYFQPVGFVSRQLVPGGSSLALERDGRTTPLVVGDEAVISLRYVPSAAVDAPLAFAGYGLSIPGSGHDDLAGLDVKGKVVVYFTGTPSGIPGELLAHAQSATERWAAVAKAGAVGLVAISPPASRDVPWSRVAQRAANPTLRIADATLDDTAGQQIGLTVNETGAAKLLDGSGHDFASLAALAARHEPLPRFALPSRLRAALAFTSAPVASENVVGILRGSDPALAGEHIVLSAHLDHVGVGDAVDGDRVYNGAMDNASGIATLLETARRYKDAPAPKRSVVFVAVTAEEQGLLGSRYFAAYPTVPRSSMVANVNVDMFLPLYPMRSVIGLGAEESDLGDDLQRAAAAAGVPVVADPEPGRRSFIRSDQYSFIRAGIPALSLKLGYALGSPEHEILKQFRARRYHAPSDDLAQPIDFGAAAAFNRFYFEVVQAIANRPTRPAWKDTSPFKRAIGSY